MILTVFISVLFGVFVSTSSASTLYNDYRIGRGIFGTTTKPTPPHPTPPLIPQHILPYPLDVTGPVTQVGFMGYAMLQQVRGLFSPFSLFCSLTGRSGRLVEDFILDSLHDVL